MITKIIIFQNNWNIINRNVVIGKNTIIRGSTISGEVKVGSDCKIKRTEIQGKVEIGNFTSLWGPNIELHAKINKIKIGNFCSVARNTSFQEYNHNFSAFSSYFINKNLLKNDLHHQDIVSKGSILIENDVWIGTHCVILSGAHISNGVVVAANSVVTGYIPPYAIVAGSPAKVIKYRFEETIRRRLLETAWWNWDIQKIRDNIELLKEIPFRSHNAEEK